MELVTTHTHTNYTGHGHGSVAELVQAASAAGIKTIAVTEHYPLSKEIDPTNLVSMKHSDVENYISDIETAAQANQNMNVLCGCELDWLGADEDRNLAKCDFSPFDVILGSVHYIDLWAFDNPSLIDKWDEMGKDAVWRRYFEVWCEAASCKSAPFTIMSHPDIVKKFGYRPSFDPAKLYSQAAEAVQSTGRMVEVNTSGATYACKEMYPAPELLREFCRAGIPCTVGTDAHTPADVARGIEDAYKLMWSVGYKCVTVPTKEGGRTEIPL